MIFIMVEGLTDQRIKSAYTPNADGLASSGVKTSAIGVLPANSASFLASLFAGADPSIHGITAVGQAPKITLLPETVGSYGRNCVFITPNDNILNGMFDRKGANSGIRIAGVKDGGNEALIKKAIEEFNRDHPFLFGIRLLNIEKEAERSGRMNNIPGVVNTVDEQIGRLLTALRSTGAYEESLIVLVGGHGKEELTGPVIMSGPGLKSGTQIPPVKITDVAPTIALLAGFQISPESTGMVLWNALRAGTGFLEENLLLKRVTDLSEENIKNIGQIYSLIEDKRMVDVEKEEVAAEKTKMDQTIEGKDREINFLKWQIRFFKLLIPVIVILFLAGYVVEYHYLRKRFLMF